MTVLAALVDRVAGRVVMGADSAAIGGDGIRWPHRKILELPVARAEPVLAATCGRAGLLPLLLDVGLPASPDPYDDDDCDAWAQAIANAWSDLARERGFIDKDGEVDGAGLIAWHHHLWGIGDHLSIRVDDYAADGSAGAIALGVLSVLAKSADDPKAVMHMAIDAAIKHHANTGPPAYVCATEPVPTR